MHELSEQIFRDIWKRRRRRRGRQRQFKVNLKQIWFSSSSLAPSSTTELAMTLTNSIFDLNSSKAYSVQSGRSFWSNFSPKVTAIIDLLEDHLRIIVQWCCNVNEWCCNANEWCCNANEWCCIMLMNDVVMPMDANEWCCIMLMNNVVMLMNGVGKLYK